MILIDDNNIFGYSKKLSNDDIFLIRSIISEDGSIINQILIR